MCFNGVFKVTTMICRLIMSLYDTTLQGNDYLTRNQPPNILLLSVFSIEKFYSAKEIDKFDNRNINGGVEETGEVEYFILLFPFGFSFYVFP